jgi:hypothetical protein
MKNFFQFNSTLGGILMKKLFMAVLTCILISFSAAGFAAKFDTCALLIADADMKTEDFMNKVSDCLKETPNVVFGTKIQTKYQEYWFQKGELEEGKITPQVLFEFRKFSGYDKCLYLITEKTIEKTKQPKLFGSYEKTRASVNIKGFLIGQDAGGADKVLKMINVTQNADSDTSDLRAKRGAFEKAMKELAKQFNEYMKSGK